MSIHWPWIAAAVVALAVVAWLIVLAVGASDGEDKACAARGGHMQTTSWIVIGKGLYPVITCTGGR